MIKGVRHKVEPNLSKTDQRALKDLLSDDSIVIRPADKGSGIVVIDTEEYVKNLKQKSVMTGHIYGRKETVLQTLRKE